MFLKIINHIFKYSDRVTEEVEYYLSIGTPVEGVLKVIGVEELKGILNCLMDEDFYMDKIVSKKGDKYNRYFILSFHLLIGYPITENKVIEEFLFSTTFDSKVKDLTHKVRQAINKKIAFNPDEIFKNKK